MVNVKLIVITPDFGGYWLDNTDYYCYINIIGMIQKDCDCMVIFSIIFIKREQGSTA
jgi:hypothetical protein